MKKILLFLLLFICYTGIMGQTGAGNKKKCSCSFATINQLGVMEGSASSSFLLQSVNGIRYKTWFAGIGAGIDYYYIRGIPLFLDIRKYLNNKATTPFIYADGGFHFGWGRERDSHFYGESDFNVGPYLDAGLGYKVGIGKDNAFIFSAGYSYKSVKETTTYFGACGWGGCQELKETYMNYLNRISLKFGLML